MWKIETFFLTIATVIDIHVILKSIHEKCTWHIKKKRKSKQTKKNQRFPAFPGYHHLNLKIRVSNTFCFEWNSEEWSSGRGPALVPGRGLQENSRRAWESPAPLPAWEPGGPGRGGGGGEGCCPLSRRMCLRFPGFPRGPLSRCWWWGASEVKLSSCSWGGGGWGWWGDHLDRDHPDRIDLVPEMGAFYFHKFLSRALSWSDVFLQAALL